jgi:hypothetical protein
VRRGGSPVTATHNLPIYHPQGTKNNIKHCKRDRSIHTSSAQENAEALVVASKENADKTKYMVMSRDQTAGRSHSTKIDSSFFKRVEEFKHLGTTLTNKNSIKEKLRAD